jgi:hypothetical protein
MRMRRFLLLPLVFAATAALSADLSAPGWPGGAAPWSWGGPSATPQTPQWPGSGFPDEAGSAWPDAGSWGRSGLTQGFIPWSSRGGAAPPGSPRSAVIPEPVSNNLTGTWRGSGGELVEIRRNTARIWGPDQQSCYCIFMVHGDRLIAYSPDTDVVRKYEFAAERDRFGLRDEHGQTMLFERIR